jgi:hypothetical protein
VLKVYGHEDRFMLWQVKQWLDDRSIPCYIKNEFTIGGIAELSPIDNQPEVWITDDEWLEKVHNLLVNSIGYVSNVMNKRLLHLKYVGNVAMILMPPDKPLTFRLNVEQT